MIEFYIATFFAGVAAGLYLQLKLQALARRNLGRPLETDLEGLPPSHICRMWARRLIKKENLNAS